MKSPSASICVSHGSFISLLLPPPTGRGRWSCHRPRPGHRRTLLRGRLGLLGRRGAVLRLAGPGLRGRPALLGRVGLVGRARPSGLAVVAGVVALLALAAPLPVTAAVCSALAVDSGACPVACAKAAAAWCASGEATVRTWPTNWRWADRTWPARSVAPVLRWSAFGSLPNKPGAFSRS